jgi:hypothetical protein
MGRGVQIRRKILRRNIQKLTGQRTTRMEAISTIGAKVFPKTMKISYPRCNFKRSRIHGFISIDMQ